MQKLVGAGLVFVAEFEDISAAAKSSYSTTVLLLAPCVYHGTIIRAGITCKKILL